LIKRNEKENKKKKYLEAEEGTKKHKRSKHKQIPKYLPI
jgi:hypothetical protein